MFNCIMTFIILNTDDAKKEVMKIWYLYMLAFMYECSVYHKNNPVSVYIFQLITIHQQCLYKVIPPFSFYLCYLCISQKVTLISRNYNWQYIDVNDFPNLEKLSTAWFDVSDYRWLTCNQWPGTSQLLKNAYEDLDPDLNSSSV